MAVALSYEYVLSGKNGTSSFSKTVKGTSAGDQSTFTAFVRAIEKGLVDTAAFTTVKQKHVTEFDVTAGA